MAITKIKSSNIADGTVVAADIADDSITNADIKSDAAIDASKLGTIPASKLSGTLDLSGKTVTLPAGAVTAHAVTPTLDSPVITGTLAVLDGATVTHTIANWSDDITYTITPTNCTVGEINVSGQFVITHTSGSPSYTIKATTASLGLADSSLVTKNIVMQLSAPTLSSPADVGTATDVVYTITSTTAFDDKLILDPGTANFTYQSVSGGGTASKVGNTVECVGFTTNNPVVTIQFTAEATYSVTAKSVNIAGTYGTSSDSAADSIQIQNSYALDYLVIGGGGAGGNSGYCGGGGAGGYRNTYNSETSGGGGSSGYTGALTSVTTNGNGSITRTPSGTSESNYGNNAGYGGQNNTTPSSSQGNNSHQGGGYHGRIYMSY